MYLNALLGLFPNTGLKGDFGSSVAGGDLGNDVERGGGGKVKPEDPTEEEEGVSGTGVAGAEAPVSLSSVLADHE